MLHIKPGPSSALWTCQAACGTALARLAGQARWHIEVRLNAFGRLKRPYLRRGRAPKHRLSLLVLLRPDGSGRSSRMPGAASGAVAVPCMLYAATKMPLRHSGAVVVARTALRVNYCQHRSCAMRGFKCGVQRSFITCGVILRHSTARRLPQLITTAEVPLSASFWGLRRHHAELMSDRSCTYARSSAESPSVPGLTPAMAGIRCCSSSYVSAGCTDSSQTLQEEVRSAAPG